MSLLIQYNGGFVYIPCLITIIFGVQKVSNTGAVCKKVPQRIETIVLYEGNLSVDEAHTTMCQL